jgi:putative endonuclease
MWHVYILHCDQKTFYVGITNDIQSRLTKHRNKESFFTKKFSEIELAHTEQFNSKIEAARREQQLKGWSQAKKIALIRNSL